MRTPLLITAALLASTGCTPGDVAFDHTSTLHVNARGLEYTDDDTAQVGMYGNTCAVDPETSNIGEDYDVVDDDDRVSDVFEDRALIANGTGATVFTPFAWDWDNGTQPEFNAPALQDSGFTADGVVLLDAFQGCTLTFHGETATAVSLDSEPCMGATLDSSGDSNIVAVAMGGQAILADASGTITTLGAADTVAFNGSDNLAYTSSGAVLAAYDLDGIEQWSVDLAGPVTSLDMLGDRVAAMVGAVDGTGELLTFDSAGVLGSTLVTPAPAERIVGSASGSELAMIVADTVHFFDAKSTD